MRGYERDEYENWDEYEDDSEEQREEEEGDEEIDEKEPEQPTQEQLEYLALRQRLKDSIRKRMKKELGTTNAGSRDKTNTFRKDNYGSFFGPAQPVISQRVIQESRSLLENPDLAARLTKSNHTNKKSSGSTHAPSRPQVNSRPTVVNGVKKKVEMLKNTRDYSFLLSEDAEVPPPPKNPVPRHLSAAKSDARPAQVLPKSKQVFNDRGGREVPRARDVRKPMPASSQSKPKIGLLEKSSGKLPVEPRKLLGNYNGSGHGRPLPPKGAPPRTSIPATRKVTVPVTKNTMSGSQRPTPSSQHAAIRKPTSSQLPSSTHRRSPPRGQPSALNKSSVQRKELHETSRPKVVPKQPLPPSRDQIRRPPPKPSAHERPKPKPKRRLDDDDSDGENAINMIRKMFGYNPNKFRDDDDVSDMEANFDDIMREEKRSAKIARKEDEEQLRLIEEEERRERMRAKKKQKLGR